MHLLRLVSYLKQRPVWAFESPRKRLRSRIEVSVVVPTFLDVVDALWADLDIGFFCWVNIDFCGFCDCFIDFKAFTY